MEIQVLDTNVNTGLPLSRFVQRNFPAGTHGDQEPLRERKLPGGDHVNQVAGHIGKLQ